MDKKILDKHAHEYIREIMADQLLNAGYTNKDGKNLHWYRVVNDNVLHAVYFYTQHAALPMFMGIAYSCHPLFIAPEYPKSVHITAGLRSLEAFNWGRMVAKPDIRNAPYSNSCLVVCPDDPHKGSDILADILSRMDGVNTVAQCYEMHKQRHITSAKLLNLAPERLFWNISSDFMDEAIFTADYEMYPYCEARIINEIRRYEKAETIRKLHKVEIADWEAIKRLKLAIMEGKRDEHLQYLACQQEINIRQLKKKLGPDIIK